MELIPIGKIVNTHGLRGELKIMLYEQELEVFEDLRKVFLTEEYKSMEVEAVKYIRNTPILKLASLDDINEAEVYKNEEIFVNKDDISLEEGEFFVDDILDFEVYEEDQLLGRVKDILNFPANDILLLEDRDKKEHMIPLVKEYIKDIDFKSKRVLVNLIEGLIE